MPDLVMQWHIQPTAELPNWFVQTVQQHAPGQAGYYAAQLLWQRGIRAPQQLAGFLAVADYQPTSPFAFGPEMDWAIARLQQARHNHEIVAIWGDFDADGVTATAVLWDGLGQFFNQTQTLVYYIPNRLTESHGLSQRGLDILHGQGCQLIVTCDTGSTNLAEIDYARSLGIDVIVTDHHTLPADRPPVTAILNPRYLPADHPLAHLSGVAVAYKLVEALYETLPAVPQKPLVNLLDLVAIGLIADLVELKGDCRYLAQKGIEQLQKQANPLTSQRPGVTKLLERCKRSGDRPTDISFGIGPRINAVSRIQGDAHFCVELLTSQDSDRCEKLAADTELANTRRRELQKEVVAQVKQQLAQLDLSTTSVIVLADEQWEPGVLGLVAGQIAHEYGRPTILLSMEPPTSDPSHSRLARGSARSANNIDLYQLVSDQAHLLYRFGGHPYAAGLSMAVENVPLFSQAINQKLRLMADGVPAPRLAIDLVVTVADLGKELFQALKLLEPCGMGNPVPRLLVRNCWFEGVWNRKLQDWQGGTVQYIKTTFTLRDESTTAGFPGVWWGHYKEDISPGSCDAVVELDFNTYANPNKRQYPHYEVRLVAVRPTTTVEAAPPPSVGNEQSWLLDWRDRAPPDDSLIPAPLILRQCPSTWSEVQAWYRRAQQEQRPLAIAYSAPPPSQPQQTWTQLVGIAKYLNRTGHTATRQQLLDKLGIGDRALQLGCKTLTYFGFRLSYANNTFQFRWQAEHQTPITDTAFVTAIRQFFNAVNEEQFRRQYFAQVPLHTIQSVMAATAPKADDPADEVAPN